MRYLLGMLRLWYRVLICLLLKSLFTTTQTHSHATQGSIPQCLPTLPVAVIIMGTTIIILGRVQGINCRPQSIMDPALLEVLVTPTAFRTNPIAEIPYMLLMFLIAKFRLLRLLSPLLMELVPPYVHRILLPPRRLPRTIIQLVLSSSLVATPTPCRCVLVMLVPPVVVTPTSDCTTTSVVKWHLMMIHATFAHKLLIPRVEHHNSLSLSARDVMGRAPAVVKLLSSIITNQHITPQIVLRIPHPCQL